MGLRNSPEAFGLISRVIHWVMAALILGQLALGLRLETLQPGLANLWLFGLHKSLGMTVLALALLRLVWHRVSPPPPPLGAASALANRAARAAHHLLYLLMLAIPLTGWGASSATGLDVLVFDRWVIPPIAPVSERWETLGFAAHGLLARLLMLVLLAHVLGALKRAHAGDGTLKRMVLGHR